MFAPSFLFDYFSILRATLSLFRSLSHVLPSSHIYRSDEDHTYVVTIPDDRRMILGRHSVLVKFVEELLRRRCQINRGKALLSRSNRQRGEMEKTQSELGRDMSSFASPIVKLISRARCTRAEYDVNFKSGKERERERERSRELSRDTRTNRRRREHEVKDKTQK